MIFETDTFESPFDGLSVLDQNQYYADAILSKYQRVPFQLDARLLEVTYATYKASARIGIPTPSYQMDVIIVYDSNDPRFQESFINTFLWSYANEYNKVDQAILMMVHRLKLDFATSDDLDQYWGNVLGVRRRANESDADYRTRLATHIRIITSSGTKQNIETVIDRITGFVGGSEIETFWPATVRLSWTATNVAKSAYTKQSLINDAMDRAIAAGVTWSTSYPFLDYQMDMKKCFENSTYYQAAAAISKKRGYQYHMNTGFWETKLANCGGIESMRMGALLYGPALSIYEIMTRIIDVGSASYQLDARILPLYGFDHSVTYQFSGYKEKTLVRTYSMSAELI